jgi:hypothetical protein
MKKITALVLFSILTVICARADVIFQDTFNYSNGPVSITSTNGTGSTTISNWITHSGNIDCFVNNRQLEVSSSSTYLGVTTTRTGDVHRNFANTNNSIYTNTLQVLYASFIVTFTNLPTTNGTYFAHFYTASGLFPGALWALEGNAGQPTNNFAGLPSTFRFGVGAGTAAVNHASPNKIMGLDLALNTPYQIIMELNPTASTSGDGVASDAVALWINPISASDNNIVSGDSYAPTATTIPSAFAFRQASGFGGFADITNLVIATTFNEALTNVLATNAVAPQIAYQPPAITTNFINTAASLSAVADGQGQSSLTYQWQVSSSPANTSPANVTNPNGNTNVLSLDTTALGNNYYTLIVTTMFGLSTTSSVAKVAIVPAVGPPVFVTQPASKTTFSGDTVTLTTSITTPGNPTYTWFSNNVVVTAGQADSGLSSSYVIPNVTAGSANYKVAVTNDTTTAGIVSSNAVVTVNPIQAVSIAYVRSLIDPATLQATNTTTPYQITGIVTTLTNITSGNTSSYYLQDGTAGINVFATFGSTFRPAQGDSVTFVGVTSSFSSGLELGADLINKPYTGGVINSHGNALPTPLVIPFTLTNTTPFVYLATNTAGLLVTLTNVYFGTNAGTTISATANQNVVVTNASGVPFVLSFYDLDQDTTNQVMPSFASSVTGVLFGNLTNLSVAVTKFSDIVAGSPAVSPIPLSAVFAGGNITFNWSDASFSLQTATNVLGPWSIIPGATPGFSTNIITTDPEWFFRLYHP